MVNFTGGSGTNPKFLIWLGGASALGAAISIAWLNYARPGLELNREIRKAEARLREVEGQKKASEDAAQAASKRAYEVLERANRLWAGLQSLPERTAHRVEEARATHRALRDLAKFSFSQGRLDRQQHAEEPPPATLSKREGKRLIARLEELARDANIGRWN